jgi:hypothetical protein
VPILLGSGPPLAGGSEVLLSYSSPSDGTDPVVEEVWEKASRVLDSTGEGFVGYYPESEMQRLVREAGFRDAIQHPNDVLDGHNLAARPGGLRLHPIERLLTAVP